MGKSKQTKRKIFEVRQQIRYLSDGIDGLKKILDEDPLVKEYAFCVHDKDEGVEPHVHVCIRMKSSMPFETVANKFGVPLESVRKIRYTFGHVLGYMTHATRKARSEGKHLYQDEEVCSNFDWQTERNRALEHEKSRLSDMNVLHMIADGRLRVCDLNDMIPLEQRLRIGEKKIAVAANVAADSAGLDCNQKNILVLGESGVGKTVYAKYLAASVGKGKVFMSGAENDIWELYAGEPVAILDDFRPDLMSFTEFLRLADKNTATPVRSRYHNKRPMLDLLIMTTILSLDEFLEGFQRAKGEDPKQILRRMDRVIELSRGKMVTTLFDDGKPVGKEIEPFSYKDYLKH